MGAMLTNAGPMAASRSLFNMFGTSPLLGHFGVRKPGESELEETEA